MGTKSSILKKSKMKNLKLILASFLLIAFVGCEDDDRDTQFVDNVDPPSEVMLHFNVTQDNTGLVTITPTAVGATQFDISFGDGTSGAVTLDPGQGIDNVYDEGTYTVGVTATGINGLTTQAEQQLVVSFIAPQNLMVTIENDGLISNTVNVTASAEYAMTYQVEFGEDGVDSVVSANIEEGVSYTYQASGFYTITVTAYSAATETAQYIEENFEVTEVLQPVVAAPTPTHPAPNVIAIYSDAYTPITTTEFPTSWSNSGYEEIQVEGNNTIKYSDLAFTGIVTDYANPTNLNSMDFVHFDYWTADASTLAFKIVNTVLDPVQEDIESVGDITEGEWVSVDIPLDDFDLDRSQITQLLFDTLGNTATVFIDNLYFYVDAPNAPLVAAPTPTIDAASVIAIYSDAYTPITTTEFPTSWSDSGYEEIQIAGNNTIRYADLLYTGIVTDYGNPTDLTGMSFVHFDYWTPDASQLGLKLVNTALDPVQEDIEMAPITLGTWVSVDIPLDDFDMDRSQVTQILFDAFGDSSDVFIDNLFFYAELPTEPTVAAPDPTLPDANVISMFSDVYTDVPVDTWNTSWSAAIFEDVMIDGNATKKYSNLNFNGTETVGTPIDASGMTHLHLDIWTPDITAFRVKLVDFLGDGFGGSGDTEAELTFTPALSGWVSLDIPLTDFTTAGMSSTSDINQFIISGDPSGLGTVYIDNVYFHN